MMPELRLCQFLLTFRKYREHLGLCQASAVVMTQDDLPFAKSAALVVKNPYLTYARMAQILDTTVRRASVASDISTVPVPDAAGTPYPAYIVHKFL